MIGLAMALVAMLAIGRFVGAQETGNCDGCAGWATLETKIKDWGGWLDWGKTKTGIVAVALTPSPEKGTAVLTAFKEFDEMVHRSKDLKMCAMCKEMEKISTTKGTTVELVPLRTGVIYMMGSKKGKTIEALHAVYDKGQAEMEKAAAACSDPTCAKKGHPHKDTCLEQDGKLEKNEPGDELNLK
jgi:hypothetical protein